MYKKFFALLIALCVSTAPICAETETAKTRILKDAWRCVPLTIGVSGFLTIPLAIKNTLLLANDYCAALEANKPSLYPFLVQGSAATIGALMGIFGVAWHNEVMKQKREEEYRRYQEQYNSQPSNADCSTSA
jgi:hypothetical protein